MTARIRHGDGDRRLLAYADLAPFVEAKFDQLAAAGAAGVRLLRQPRPTRLEPTKPAGPN